jgi:hypothetical protein
LRGALGGVLDVPGNFLRRRALLFHRRRDGRGYLRHPADGVADLLDRPHRVLRGGLDTGDLLTDLAGRLSLSASRLVWPAMVLINSTTSPMRAAAFDNSPTRSLVFCACPTASLATRDDSWTWRLISLTDEVSSSLAAATDSTLVEASSDAAATVIASSCDRSAVALNVFADASSSVAADDTISTISPTALSKVSAILIMSALRCSATRCSVARRSVRIRSTSSPVFLNTTSAVMISPISSPRRGSGVSTERSPCARQFMVATLAFKGRTIPLRATR